MEIIFTRHADQRIKLYRVDKGDLLDLLMSQDLYSLPIGSKTEYLFPTLRSKVDKPVKVIAVREVDELVVITVYPLKKGISK